MTDTSRQPNSLPPPSAPAFTSRHGHRLFYGWWVVLSAAVAVFWGVPVTVYSFSVFLKPLGEVFHTTRAAVSLTFTLRSVVDAICTPFVGWLIARFGTRRVILPSAVMFGLILLSVRVLSGGIGQFYVSYVAFALAASIGLGPLAYGNVVSCWFDQRRGLALGLTMVGIGCGALIMPPFAQLLIAKFGWRNAYAILGAAVLLIPVPIVAASLRKSQRISDSYRTASRRQTALRQHATRFQVWRRLKHGEAPRFGSSCPHFFSSAQASKVASFTLQPCLATAV
jgi:MFS family permease